MACVEHIESSLTPVTRNTFIQVYAGDLLSLDEIRLALRKRAHSVGTKPPCAHDSHQGCNEVNEYEHDVIGAIVYHPGPLIPHAGQTDADSGQTTPPEPHTPQPLPAGPVPFALRTSAAEPVQQAAAQSGVWLKDAGMATYVASGANVPESEHIPTLHGSKMSKGITHAAVAPMQVNRDNLDASNTASMKNKWGGRSKQGREVRPHKSSEAKSHKAAGGEGCPQKAAAYNCAVSQAAANKDRGVTLVIRNIPKWVTQQQVLRGVADWGFMDDLVVLYVPVHLNGSQNNSNLGYGFVHMQSKTSSENFMAAWRGQYPFGQESTSSRPIDISLALRQGIEENIATWNSSKTARLRNPNFRPMILKHIDGLGLSGQ